MLHKKEPKIINVTISIGSWFAKQSRKDVMEANNGFLITPQRHKPENTELKAMDQILSSKEKME